MGKGARFGVEGVLVWDNPGLLASSRRLLDSVGVRKWLGDFERFECGVDFTPPLAFESRSSEDRKRCLFAADDKVSFSADEPTVFVIVAKWRRLEGCATGVVKLGKTAAKQM